MRDRKPDKILFWVTMGLLVLGISVLASISTNFSLEKTGSPTYFLFHQIKAGIIPGIILLLIAFKIPLEKLKEFALHILIASLFLVVLVFVPVVGISLGGANRWIGVGSFSFQPSELLKLATFLYLAVWLSNRLQVDKKKHKVKNDQVLFPFLIILAIIGLLLVFQPDVSTLGVIIGVSILMFFLAGGKFFDIFIMILIGLSSLVLLIKIAPYRLERLLVFLRPGLDPLGTGYQIKQSLIAIGSGGIFGVGLGMSLQKFGLLPQPMVDTIFAIFAEEIGFLGSLVLISLFLIFLCRGFEIGKRAKDKFLQLLAFTITSWIVLQAFINMGSIIGILPLTGIPLPFISYGGSHLVVELIGVGILLNISKQV